MIYLKGKELVANCIHANSARAQAPFTIHLRGTGTFRPISEVVFVALSQGISECELLAEAIRSAQGLQRDSRFPYHPHVTVAQDVPPAALDAVFEDLSQFSARFDDHDELVEYDGVPPEPGSTVPAVVERQSEWTQRLILRSAG